MKALSLDRTDPTWNHSTLPSGRSVTEDVPVGKVEMPDGIEKMIGFVGLPDATGFYTRTTESLVDNSVGGFAKMKKKGIVGFIGMEVHD